VVAESLIFFGKRRFLTANRGHFVVFCVANVVTETTLSGGFGQESSLLWVGERVI
jgi:hypothetical protein